MVGGGIAGARVGMENPNATDLSARSREAGRNFVRNNLPAIVFTSLGAAALGSLTISFSGLLPWCRKPREDSAVPPVPVGR